MYLVIYVTYIKSIITIIIKCRIDINNIILISDGDHSLISYGYDVYLIIYVTYIKSIITIIIKCRIVINNIISIYNSDRDVVTNKMFNKIATKIWFKWTSLSHMI